MIIEEIKKQNFEAMKNKQPNLRAIYSIVLNKYTLQEINSRGAEAVQLTDDDTVKIIQKTIKELQEEAENYKKVNHMEDVEKINEQIKAIEVYLPKMLSHEEIVEELNSLTDKSMPSVMSHFKHKFGNSVDLKLVGQILRGM